MDVSSDFDDWAVISARLRLLTQPQQTMLLTSAGVAAVWPVANDKWRATLVDDIAEGNMERAFRYSTVCADESATPHASVLNARTNAARPMAAAPQPIQPATSLQVQAAHPTPQPLQAQRHAPVAPAATAVPQHPAPAARSAHTAAPQAAPLQSRSPHPSAAPSAAAPAIAQRVARSFGQTAVHTASPAPTSQAGAASNASADFRHAVTYGERANRAASQAGAASGNFRAALAPQGPAPKAPGQWQRETAKLSDSARDALRPAMTAMGWSVEQYAHVCAKVETARNRQAALAPFGLNDESWAHVVHSWRRRLTKNAQLRQRYEASYSEQLRYHG